MSTRSLNKVLLIGNLTRDPELKYTPQGTAVCQFGLATNREWTDSSGQKQEGAEFHQVVAWGKLAEICSQPLGKGKRVFVEGRIQTRKWEDKDGNPRTTTEIVISDMLLLERIGEGGGTSAPTPQDIREDLSVDEAKPAKKAEPKKEAPADDIPF